MPGDRSLFFQLTVKENLKLGAARGSADLDQALGYFPALTKLMDRKAGLLSGGEQQMLAMGRALMAEPRLLLLDEPTSGMNPRETEEFDELITKIRGLGKTILLIEHDMSVVMGVSDVITVLNFGEKIAEGAPEPIRKDQRVIEAYLGTED